MKYFKSLFLIVFFVSLFYSVSIAGQIKYTVGGHTAAISENLLDKVVDLSISKDYEALQKLFDSGLVILLKSGIKVEVIELNLFSGTIKIRPFGMNLEIWTVREALKE